jgi:hypothetical protein
MNNKNISNNKTFRKLIGFCKSKKIGKDFESPLRKNAFFFSLNTEELNIVSNEHGCADLSKGGLILGKSHREGGVLIVQIVQLNPYPLFAVVGELEGNEYVVSTETYRKHKQKFDSINKSIKPNSQSYAPAVIELVAGCKVHDIRKFDIQMVITLEGSMVINSFATRDHLKRIIELDK